MRAYTQQPFTALTSISASCKSSETDIAMFADKCDWITMPRFLQKPGNSDVISVIMSRWAGVLSRDDRRDQSLGPRRLRQRRRVVLTVLRAWPDRTATYDRALPSLSSAGAARPAQPGRRSWSRRPSARSSPSSKRQLSLQLRRPRHQSHLARCLVCRRRRTALFIRARVTSLQSESGDTRTSAGCCWTRRADNWHQRWRLHCLYVWMATLTFRRRSCSSTHERYLQIIGDMHRQRSIISECQRLLSSSSSIIGLRLREP